MALLLYRRRLGVALGDDQPPQRAAVFAGHFLPCAVALVRTEVDPALRVTLGEKDAPAILGHLHVTKVRPALGIDADGSAQIHRHLLRALRPHLAPPVQILRLPVLECALQGLVRREVDVVGDPLAVIDGHSSSSDTIPVELRLLAGAKYLERT
jgi:hypothetical protein